MRPASCELWWARPRAAGAHLAELLDDEERRRCAGFVRDADRRRFLVAHALTRIVAARDAGCAPHEIGVRREAGPNGKPQLAGPAAGLRFSLSHSGDRVVVAIGRGAELGVDVERVGAATEELAATILCPTEQLALGALPAQRRAWGLCRYWTRKEAVLKATGHGLSVEPVQLCVTAPDDAPALVDWAGAGRPTEAVHLHDLAVDGAYTAALATIGGPLACSAHDASALLRAYAR